VSKNIEKKWSTDWNTFAEQLIELLDAGVSDADISAQFRGKEVQCEGLITDVKLDDKWVPLITMIEDYDDKVDLSEGYPGYFGHALESGDLKSFCKLCIDSLKRKPTGLMAGLLSRVYRDHGDDYGLGLDIFESVLKHPLANVSAKEIAEDLL